MYEYSVVVGVSTVQEILGLKIRPIKDKIIPLPKKLGADPILGGLAGMGLARLSWTRQMTRETNR